MPGSMTPGSRYFLLECRCCHRAVTGSYGTWDEPDVHQEARQLLSKFVVDKDAGDAGEV